VAQWLAQQCFAFVYGKLAFWRSPATRNCTSCMLWMTTSQKIWFAERVLNEQTDSMPELRGVQGLLAAFPLAFTIITPAVYFRSEP
jgi:hypothetical protein